MSISKTRNAHRLFVLNLAAMFAASACAEPTTDENQIEENQARTSSAASSNGSLSAVRLTNYTLARERDFASRADFLCSGRGVAMQGTGIGNDGRYIKYVRGGGGWCGNYARLCDCASAEFATVDRVFGASGRTLVKNYSVAVDPNVISLGSSLWIGALGRWFRADDTGGGIKGRHVDVYTEDENPSYFLSTDVVVSSTAHAPTDPGPNGEPPPAGPAQESEPCAGITFDSWYCGGHKVAGDNHIATECVGGRMRQTLYCPQGCQALGSADPDYCIGGEALRCECDGIELGGRPIHTSQCGKTVCGTDHQLWRCGPGGYSGFTPIGGSC
jgi:3D (Asp-Asp-Asp) domain-containing protein